VWKRKNEKRKIPCPLCPKSAQWIQRHVEDVHKLSPAEAQLILANSEGYKRLEGKTHTNVLPRTACSKCGKYVTRLSSHMKTAHQEFGVMDGIIPPSPVRPGVVSIPVTGISMRMSAPNNSHYDQSDSHFLQSGDQSSQGDNHPVDEFGHILDSHEIATSSGVQCDMPIESHCNNSDSSDDDSQADLFGTNSISNNSAADTGQHALINEFKEHMAGVNGGAKARPEAYSLASKQILNAVGNDIARLTKDNIYAMYVNPMLTHQSEVSVKTIRSKLKHLEYFCKYLIEEKSQMLEDTGSNTADITRVINALPAWRQSLKKKCLAEEVQRRVLDVAEQIYPKDIQNYLASNYATSARDLLSSASSSKYNSYDFARARNHLLVLLSVSNAHRTGVLTNFTINDYHAGLAQFRSTNANSLVFIIAEHKTAGAHGAATLAVSSEEAELLAGYMQIRQKAELASAAPFVFITQTGKKMTQSLVSSSLTTAFAASGYSERVNCTKLRKAAVTQVHSNFPDKRSDVAAHMLHRTNTAESTYRIISKSTNTVACSNLLRKTMTQHLEAQESAGKCDNQDDIHVPYQRKISWSAENRELVRAKFDTFVKRQQTPIKEIQAMLESDQVLLSKLESDFHLSGRNLVSVVKDKVRSFFRSKYGFGKR